MRVLDLPVPHEDGSFVSQKVSRIIEMIRDYDKRLDVRWIPKAARTNGEAAFAIVEEIHPGDWRTAFLIQTEEEFDERVLARIYNADSSKHGDVTVRLAAMERAQKELRKKEQEEEYAEMRDYSEWAIGTKLHNPKHNGRRLNF